MTPLFIEQELFALRSFRRAAAKIHPIIDRHWGHRFTHRSMRPGKPDEADLLLNETFVTLLVALRLVYAQKEAANFFKVHNIIFRYGNEEEKAALKHVKSAWQRYLTKGIFFRSEGGDFDPQRTLDTWINAEVMHQAPDIQADLDHLLKFDLAAHVAVQATTWKLSHAVLALDSLVAGLLGEVPLMRAPVLLPTRL